MMLTSDITIGEAGVYALLGYAVVFFGLILLMAVVIALGNYRSRAFGDYLKAREVTQSFSKPPDHQFSRSRNCCGIL